MKTRLNKKEVDTLARLSDKLWKLTKKYDEENGGKDVMLDVDGNGSVYDQLSCATCAIDTILQEYI